MSRQKDPSWFKTWFGKDYLRVYPKRNDEEAVRNLPFLERELHLTARDRILDLCCGDGRYSIPLAEKGYRVVGQDLSFELLSPAREKAGSVKGEVTFFQADMRTALFPDFFDALINMFTSFGYFSEDRENLLTLKNIRVSLKRRGRFVIDYLNPDFVINRLEPETVEKRENYLIRQTRRYDERGKRIEKTILIEEGEDQRRYQENVRLYSRGELEAMLTEAGLALKSVYGNFDHSPFGLDAPRMILCGQKH